MRGLPLLCATIVASLVLSGCLQGLLSDGTTQDPPPASGPEWFELPLPSSLPMSGLLALWVPEGTQGLRMATVDANDTEPYFDPDAWNAPSSRYPAIDRMLVVRSPDNAILAAGADHDIDATGTVTTGAMQYDPSIFLDIHDPTPGLYVIALFSGHLPPRVTLHLPDDTDAYPILPLGIGYARHMLAATFDEGVDPIDHRGTLTAPPHALRADVDLRGYGVHGQIALVNQTGDPIATHEAVAPRWPGETQLNPFIISEPLLRTFDSDPAATTPGAWKWDASLTGTGYAFAWTGRSIDLPHPTPLPRGSAPADALVADSARERVPLAGAIRPGEAAWFTMPDDARLRPLFDRYGDTYQNGQHFRVYDQNGARVMWDLVPDDSRAYPLPSGRLLIVNDGTEDLRVEILDGAPADASLHMAQTETTRVNLNTPYVGGYWEESASVFLPGPVSGIVATHYDDHFTDLSISVAGLDGRIGANLPRVGYDGPAFPYYCCSPIGGQTTDLTPWLDGGRYRITASAIDVNSLAGLDIDLVTYVLDGGIDTTGESQAAPTT